MPVPGSPRIAHFGFPPQSHLSMHPDGRVVMPCQRLRTPCSAPVAPSLACSSMAALTRERRQFMPRRLPVTALFTVHDHRINKTLCGVLGSLCLFWPSWLAIASPLSIEHYSSTEKLTEVARNLIPNNDGELPSLCIVLLHNSRGKCHGACRVADQARILLQTVASISPSVKVRCQFVIDFIRCAWSIIDQCRLIPEQARSPGNSGTLPCQMHNTNSHDEANNERFTYPRVGASAIVDAAIRSSRLGPTELNCHVVYHVTDTSNTR